MHLAAKLLGRVHAHYTDKFNSPYESELSTCHWIHLCIVHWKPNTEKILKYQEVCKCKREINKTSEADFWWNRKQKQTNQPNDVTLYIVSEGKQMRKRLFADLKVLLITFASQMICQSFISPYVCKHPTDFRIIANRLLSYLVKLIRAQGGCLGTKSRRKTW